jgi:hypothetical protein
MVVLLLCCLHLISVKQPATMVVLLLCFLHLISVKQPDYYGCHTTLLLFSLLLLAELHDLMFKIIMCSVILF